MAYIPYGNGIEFKDYPDKSTPRTATRLNTYDVGLTNIENELPNVASGVYPSTSGLDAEGITFGYDDKFDFYGYFKPGSGELLPFTKRIVDLNSNYMLLEHYGLSVEDETDSNGNTYELIDFSKTSFYRHLTADNFKIYGFIYSASVTGTKTLNIDFKKSYNPNSGKFRFLKRTDAYDINVLKFKLIIE